MSTAPARSAPHPPHEEDEVEHEGASPNERLLAAAKSDNEEMLEAALSELENINYADGLGNTALHYAIITGSTTVLETILEHDTCDVDLRNRLAGDAPLHIAVRQRWEEYPGLRLHLVTSLLEAGADTKTKNRHNQRPVDILPPAHLTANDESDDEQVRAAIRRAEATAYVADKGDVVHEDEDAVFDPSDIASDSD